MTRSASHHRPGKPLSALGQSTRRHYRNGSHYRHPHLDNAKRRPARDATIGTRRRRRARGSRRFAGCPKGPACVDGDPTGIGPATRPASRWTAYADGPSGQACASQRGAIIGARNHYRHTCHMTSSQYRRVKPLSAHVRANASPHWCPPKPLRSHYRHAQSGSKTPLDRTVLAKAE